MGDVLQVSSLTDPEKLSELFSQLFFNFPFDRFSLFRQIPCPDTDSIFFLPPRKHDAGDHLPAVEAFTNNCHEKLVPEVVDQCVSMRFFGKFEFEDSSAVRGWIFPFRLDSASE